ncbi:TIGR03084 family metal-binding protein [Streptomyces sp. NRRL S-495]|uniref:TIGR03084 family metal-binding protein n=1 Tax=Streptomyces sp. NRRL S-495 TaxID=1609133 RepID=UPI0005F8C77E|nr:TIGR03084 family metal-binding protein [Streptomyces sp. NRRL S-495]KJY31337.1 wyosine base formation domain-containing protein [Streptomyces sp. NRRL S-495]
MTDPNVPGQSSVLTGLLADLRAESEVLDGLVAGLEPDGWALDTPAAGWTVAHQIAHLAWTDDWSELAARDPGAFVADSGRIFGELLTAGADPVEDGAARGAAEEPAALLTRWRAGRERLATALAEVPAGTTRPWLGPPMKAPSMATARLMETWAHGQDVADALGAVREPSARLRHVAHLGVRTMGFAFTVHGLPAPQTPVRVELTAPDGGLWTWGPEGAADRVDGPALDFCLLVTQRRHRDDLALTAVGEVATAWLPIAQAFAGPPGKGRQSGFSL